MYFIPKKNMYDEGGYLYLTKGKRYEVVGVYNNAYKVKEDRGYFAYISKIEASNFLIG